MLIGGCHCGAIRYEATGEPFERAVCHCALCRATTGAPAVAWFTVPSPDFRITAGEPASYAATPQAVRQFCGRCGAQLTFIHEDYGGERIDVTTATLDDPSLAPPVEQIYVRSRIPWMADLHTLPDDLERRPKA